MDILILNWMDIRNPGVGGAEIILYELAKRLVKEGNKVTWFSRTFHKCLEHESIDGIKIFRSGNKYTVYWRAYLYYRNLVKKPQLVIESINTLCWMTPWYVPENNRVAYINQLAGKVLLHQLPPLISQIAYLCERLEYLPYKSTKFISYAPSVKNDLVQFGIPEDNIQTFTLGIDHSRYYPGVKSKQPLFVFVARLVKMKRANLCIDAMKHLVKDHPQVKLAIIGYGPEEKKLQKQIRTLNLRNNVVLVNKNNLFFEKHVNDEKVKLMQKAWALLLPSVKEGWGMVVTEAAACGTPSIVSNVTGLVDSVQNDKTGVILSKYPNERELAESMNKIIQDRQYRNRLSEDAVLWSKNFTWDKSYKQFLQIIKK